MDSTKIQLSIELHPEFGWTIKNQPVFGPGSIISGHVNINILDQDTVSKIDKIRIIFHGSEKTMNLNTKTLIKRKQFFGSQKTIWNSKYQDGDLTAMQKHSFPFIIQLPMVQFPPTMDYPNYKCYYMISAYIDEIENNHLNTTASATTQAITLLEHNQPILYMPFLETCLFKTPLSQFIAPKSVKNKKNNIHNHNDHNDHQHHITLTTHALDYVPGDSIKMDVMIPEYYFEHHDSNDNKPSCVFSSVTMELVQTVKTLYQVHQSSISTIQLPLSSVSASSSSSLNSLKITKQLEFPLPSDLTPSITYSDTVSVNYSLHIQFHQHKSRLSSIFSLSSQHYKLNLPIRIGTLGYGIRPSEELQVYSIFKTSFDKDDQSDTRPSLPNPRFLQNAEYEEALPVYEPDPQLPTYDNTTSFLNNNPISIIPLN